MAGSSTFPLYDRILGGELTALLRGWRDEEVSVQEMAWRLREREVSVTPETVRRWLKALDADAAVA